jgi:4-alpha-glucanotransferase
MPQDRSAGILLHPVSLPGSRDIGELGTYAYRFVDFMVESGIDLWQILPLGPTSYGNSPYTALSSFAGNPLLIALDRLAEEGWLPANAVEGEPEPGRRVDYEAAYARKYPLLQRAARTFLDRAAGEDRRAFARFCERERYWLDDYALYLSIKAHYDRRAAREGADNAMWNRYWPQELALREESALEGWRSEHAEEIEREKVLQFFFHRQWHVLKRYANERGISIFGDIPIFVAMDSADVWAHRELFQLDRRGRPEAVAGVPPDYFSSTGQRWGNPLFHWEAHRAEGFAWWIRRLKKSLEMADMVRIDHFRAFSAYWRIPVSSATATEGEWVDSPGREFFRTLREELGELPVVAEDLGVITPEVLALRDEFGLPGMKVLQFGFGINGEGRLDAQNYFLPHNHERNAVVYTGTHDNDTTPGWYARLGEAERDAVRRYLARGDHEVPWELVRQAYASVARQAVVPMQDLLGLGSEARMNTPSTVGGNWSWRLKEGQLSGELASRLRELGQLYGRSR